LVDLALRDAASDIKGMITLVEEVGRLLHELVKVRFALSMEATTYEAVGSLRIALGDYEWERLAEKSAALRTLGRDAYEGLRLLVKTGATDDRLLRALEIILGSRAEARTLASKLADGEGGLSEDIRLWLLGQPPKRISAAALDSRLMDLDGILADLTLANRSLKDVAQQLRRDIADELGVVAPRLAEQMASMSDQASAVASLIDLASHHRGMEVRGTIGDIVEFIPAEHQVIGGAVAGIRRVRIVMPAVFSRHGMRVVKKAVVEVPQAAQ